MYTTIQVLRSRYVKFQKHHSTYEYPAMHSLRHHKRNRSTYTYYYYFKFPRTSQCSCPSISIHLQYHEYRAQTSPPTSSTILYLQLQGRAVDDNNAVSIHEEHITLTPPYDKYLSMTRHKVQQPRRTAIATGMQCTWLNRYGLDRTFRIIDQKAVSYYTYLTTLL